MIDTKALHAPAPTVGDDLDLLTARLKSANAGATNAPLGYVEDMHEAATALTTLRERVATEAERAFRDGLAYGNTVEPGDDDFDAYADEAWRTSQARARTAIGE